MLGAHRTKRKVKRKFFSTLKGLLLARRAGGGLGVGCRAHSGAEMTKAIDSNKGKQSQTRPAHRSGYYSRGHYSGDGFQVQVSSDLHIISRKSTLGGQFAGGAICISQRLLGMRRSSNLAAVRAVWACPCRCRKNSSHFPNSASAAEASDVAYSAPTTASTSALAMSFIAGSPRRDFPVSEIWDPPKVMPDRKRSGYIEARSQCVRLDLLCLADMCVSSC
jgi:hypothetical protein